MKKKLLLASVFALLFIVALPSCKNHPKHLNDSDDELTDSETNDLTKKLHEVEQYWQHVENQYQRRIDLYKNITKSVKAAAEHEHSTQQDVVEARAKAQQKMQAIETTADSLKNIKLDPNDADALNKYAQAQERMREQMQIAINVVHEAYPDLKANENFLNLQAQIEGTENRITVALHDYLEAVKYYNQSLKELGKDKAENSDFKEMPLIKPEE